MSSGFGEKRMEYLNNWPNVEAFQTEIEYKDKVEKIKKEYESIFIPFKLKWNGDVEFNKAVSFMIDAVEELETYPNHAFEFMFKSYDCFSSSISKNNITDRNKELCNKWSKIIESHPCLSDGFNLLLSKIPMVTVQYLYSRLTSTNDEKIYKRATTQIGGQENNQNLKDIVDRIYSKYGYDYGNYKETIREASSLYKKVFQQNKIEIDENKFTISLEDKLNLLVSGYLYTLRNDGMHGNSISITKSSKTKIRTYANSFFAFLFTYYLIIILIVDKYKDKDKYSLNVYTEVKENMEVNVNLYTKLFGTHIGK